MQDYSFIKEEHEMIRKILNNLDYHIQQTYNHINREEFIKIFRELLNIWEIHEEKEENAFINIPQAHFDKFKMEHKQLRGHLTVIEKAILSDSETNLWVALNTDGEMLISKLRQHMDEEDRFIESVEEKE
jgi:hemerythrin